MNWPPRGSWRRRTSPGPRRSRSCTPPRTTPSSRSPAPTPPPVASPLPPPTPPPARPPTSATLPGPRSVRPTAGPLREGYVHELAAEGILASPDQPGAAAEPLLHTAAYYTLQRIPGPDAPPGR